MISFIYGEIVDIYDNIIIIENNNIGYEIMVPQSVISSVACSGCKVKIFTYMNVREDEISLFGFLTKDDLQVFKLLIGVNGIGPKGALGILTNLTVEELRIAVASEDVKAISRAQGIGTKTAQKLIIELKDKLTINKTLLKNIKNDKFFEESNTINDAILGLNALGYNNIEISKAIHKINNISQLDTEQIIKQALKNLV